MPMYIRWIRRVRRLCELPTVVGLLALAVFVMFGTGCGSVPALPGGAPAVRVSPTSVSGPRETATATIHDRLLGDRLGAAQLHMSSKQVLAALGAPLQKTIANGLGTPVWRYADGISVYLTNADAAVAPDSVWQLSAQLPFPGKTTEGYQLGDSSSAFKRIYNSFSITAEQSSQLQIVDNRGTLLDVTFNPEGVAISLVLEDTKLP